MEIHSAARRGDLAALAFCLERKVPIDQPDDDGRTALWHAAGALAPQHGGAHATLETLHFLLERGANPDGRSGDGQSAVFAAAGSLDVAALELLHSRGADLRRVADSQYTPMVLAAYQPAGPAKLDTLRWLAGHGVSPDVTTSYGESPLSVAALHGDFDSICLLLELGADPARLQWTPIFHAVAFGGLDEVRAELPSARRDLRDRWERTALQVAAQRGRIDAAELLRGAGFDPGARARCGVTTLALAAARNEVAMLRWLLAQGADLDETDDFGRTALMAAAGAGACDAIGFLLEAGADPRRKSHVGSEAVHETATWPALQRLLDRVPEAIDAIDGCGEWPLKLAASRNDVAAIDGLHARGATIDLTSTGETALHEAIKCDALEAAARLLALGADPNAQDVDLCTPLWVVRSRAAVQLLLAHGLDPKIKDQCANTAHRFLSDPLVLELLPGARKRR